jgi:hypothetical protein
MRFCLNLRCILVSRSRSRRELYGNLSLALTFFHKASFRSASKLFAVFVDGFGFTGIRYAFVVKLFSAAPARGLPSFPIALL